MKERWMVSKIVPILVCMVMFINMIKKMSLYPTLKFRFQEIKTSTKVLILVKLIKMEILPSSFPS